MAKGVRRFATRLAAVALTIATELIAGCTPAQLVVNIDPELERGAEVFDVPRPATFRHEDSLNVTFGPYRVTGMDIGWSRTSSKRTGGDYRWDASVISLPDSPLDWLEVDNLLRPYIAFLHRERFQDTVTQKLRYEFSSEGSGTWTARCKYVATQDRVETDDIIRFGGRKSAGSQSQEQLAGFQFVCTYKQPDAEPWILTISAGAQELWDRRLLRVDAAGNVVVFPFNKPEIRLTHGDTAYRAELSMTANVVGQSQPDSKPSYQVISGYYWLAGERKIAALANVAQPVPRLWLARSNTMATNHVIAMASTGVMLFRWVISDE